MTIVKLREHKAAKEYSNWTMESYEPTEYEKIMMKKEAKNLERQMISGYLKMLTEYNENVQ